MAPEHEYLDSNGEATQALATIKDVLSQQRPYKRIRELAPACQAVEDAYNGLLSAKMTDMLDQVKDMYEDIKAYAESKDVQLSAIAQTELERRNSVNTSISLTELDALKTKLSNDQRTFYADVDREVERKEQAQDNPSQRRRPHPSRPRSACVAPRQGARLPSQASSPTRPRSTPTSRRFAAACSRRSTATTLSS